MKHLANDIAVAQALSTGAMNYAGKTITTAHGEKPIGANALTALDRAAQAIAADDQLPALAAEALKDLQTAAVVFTVQLATSNGYADPAALQQIEGKLVARLERQGVVRVVHVQEDVTAARRLSERAIDYARQIIIAEDNRVPIGSHAVENAVSNLQVTAVALTVQLAISEGHDPKKLRWIEKKLVKWLKRQGWS